MWRLCIRALHRAETACDRRFGPQGHNSPVGVLFLILRHWSCYGSVDIFTGLPFDLGGSPHSPRAFTIVAHRFHHVPFHLGFDRPFPSDLTHYEEDKVNARLENWIWNRLISSFPCPVILAMLRSAHAVVEPVIRNLGIAHTTPRFEASDALALELKYNGLADFELEHFFGIPAPTGLAIRDPNSQYLAKRDELNPSQGPVEDLVETLSKRGLQDLLQAQGALAAGTKADLKVRLGQLSTVDDELHEPGKVCHFARDADHLSRPPQIPGPV